MEIGCSMKILVITGSRTIVDHKIVFDVLDKFKDSEFTHLMHGNAKGVDRLAKQWALENNIKPIDRPGDWAKYGNAAGPIRNIEMAKEAHDISNNRCTLVAIWDGKSSGTKQMYDNWKNTYPSSIRFLYKIRPKIDWGKRNPW